MSSAVLSKIFRKLPSLLGFGLGGYAGHNMAQWENAHLYSNDTTKSLADLTGTGVGALGTAALFSPAHRATGLKLLGSLMGPKQLGLYGIDKFTQGINAVEDYTDIQNELADKNVEITKNQLEAALQNKEIASMSNETSKKWLDLANKGLPYIGGLAALITALYAYNSFKKNKGNGNVAFQIPEEKLSPQFYSRLGREILFKDRDENGRIIKRKYIKQNDIEDYTLPEYNEAVEKIASVLNIKRAANLTKDTRQLVNNVNNLAEDIRVPEAKAETIGQVIEKHPSNKTWGGFVANKLNKYGPFALEYFGLITPSAQIRQNVSFIDQNGRSRAAPSLTASSMYSDPSAVGRLYEYARNRMAKAGNPYFTHSLSYPNFGSQFF
jgi:hypothetical protein